nr:GNAT family N-acetyltransferase [uncultured Clostridium sp.]
MIYLDYNFSNDWCDSKSTFFNIDIRYYIDDEEEFYTIGNMKCVLINSYQARCDIFNLIDRLDELDDASVEFGYFLKELLNGSLEETCENIKSRAESSKIVWISDIEIEKEYRGNGIGTKVMREFVKHCNNVFEAEIIFLNPVPLNYDGDFDWVYKKLVNFYSKLGFEKVDAEFGIRRLPLYYL